MKRSTTALALIMATATPALADKAAVIDTYSDIAHAGYEDSLIKAQHTLQEVELSLAQLETEASLAFKEIEGMIGVVMVPAYQFQDGRMP